MAAVAARFCGAPAADAVEDVVDPDPAPAVEEVVDPEPAARLVVVVEVEAVVGEPLPHAERKSAPTATAAIPPSTIRIRARNRR